jgi:hypothetical protein
VDHSGLLFKPGFHISPMLAIACRRNRRRICNVDRQGDLSVNLLAPFTKAWPSPHSSTAAQQLLQPVLMFPWCMRRAISIFI